jgi:hypothetical protein
MYSSSSLDFSTGKSPPALNGEQRESNGDSSINPEVAREDWKIGGVSSSRVRARRASRVY